MRSLPSPDRGLAALPPTARALGASRWWKPLRGGRTSAPMPAPVQAVAPHPGLTAPAPAAHSEDEDFLRRLRCAGL